MLPKASQIKQKSGTFAHPLPIFFPENFTILMATATIRPATTDDASAIQQLARRIWPVAYGDILSAGQLSYMLDRFYAPESLTKQMREGQSFFLIQSKDEDIGFAAIGRVSGPQWKLHKLYVLPEYQGLGMGQKLLMHVAAMARSAGARHLILQVNRANPAKDFYERNGFLVIAEKDFDIGNGYFMNDFVMEKSL